MSWWVSFLYVGACGGWYFWVLRCCTVRMVPLVVSRAVGAFPSL